MNGEREPPDLTDTLAALVSGQGDVDIAASQLRIQAIDAAIGRHPASLPSGVDAVFRSATAETVQLTLPFPDEQNEA